jgi:hypothetical protein
VQKLSNKKGADFDAAYAKQMKEDHTTTVALFQSATKSSDADLAAFAKRTLPTVAEHKRMAGELPGAMHSARFGCSNGQGNIPKASSPANTHSISSCWPGDSSPIPKRAFASARTMACDPSRFNAMFSIAGCSAWAHSSIVPSN